MSLGAWGDGGDQDDYGYTQERVDEIVAEAVQEARAEWSAMGWLIERYVNSTLYYWNAGALHGGRDGFTPMADEAVRFVREVDAQVVLNHVCNSQGRVAQHKWVAATDGSCV